MQTIRDRVGAPECLDVPFELKALSTLRTDDGAELGVFEGLASTFGAPDLAGDVIEPGAFRASLERPRGVKMLWQHDPRAPIGVWDRIAETAAGLSDDEFFGNVLFSLGGTPSVAFDLILPAAGQHAFAVRNQTGQAVTVRVDAGASVAVADGQSRLLHSDGSDVIALAPATS